EGRGKTKPCLGGLKRFFQRGVPMSPMYSRLRASLNSLMLLMTSCSKQKISLVPVFIKRSIALQREGRKHPLSCDKNPTILGLMSENRKQDQSLSIPSLFLFFISSSR